MKTKILVILILSSMLFYILPKCTQLDENKFASGGDAKNISFSQTGGTYTENVVITLSAADDPEASIKYTKSTTGAVEPKAIPPVIGIDYGTNVTLERHPVNDIIYTISARTYKTVNGIIKEGPVETQVFTVNAPVQSVSFKPPFPGLSQQPAQGKLEFNYDTGKNPDIIIRYEITVNGAEPGEPTESSAAASDDGPGGDLPYINLSGYNPGDVLRIKIQGYETDRVPSPVEYVTYTIVDNCNAPSFVNNNPGTYNNDTVVKISGEAGTSIFYTTNGTAPQIDYATENPANADTKKISTGGTFTITENQDTVNNETVIRAVAWAAAKGKSTELTGDFTLKCATPTMTPGSDGSTATINGTISSNTTGADIKFTKSAGGQDPVTSGTPGTGFTVDQNLDDNESSGKTVIQAVATRTGYADSNIATRNFYLYCAAPSISWSGGNFWQQKAISFSSPSGGTVYYKIGSGSYTTGSSLTLKYNHHGKNVSIYVKKNKYRNSSTTTSGTYYCRGYVGLGSHKCSRQYVTPGITWGTSSPGATGLPFQLYHSGYLGITYGKGRWVGVGDGLISYSDYPDATSWHEVTASYDSVLQDVKYGNNVFVAVGSGGRITVSSDGISWTTKLNATETNFNAVAYGNGVWIAVGTRGGIYKSTTNGNTWYCVRTPVDGQEDLNGVAWSSYNGSTFAAVGNNGKALYSRYASNNGETWATYGNCPTSDNYLSIASDGSARFLAVGANGAMAWSADGMSWYGAGSHSPRNLVDVCYGNGRFVVVDNYPGGSGYQCHGWTNSNTDFTMSWGSTSGYVRNCIAYKGD